MFIHSPNKLNGATPLAATGQRMREHNVAMLLRAIWDHRAGISRAELARRLGLSRSTVSGITAELLDEELISEDEAAPSSGGRPPILLRFRDDRFVIIGVEIGGSHVTCLRTDLRGEVEHQHTAAWEVYDDPRGTIALVERLVDAALLDVGPERTRVGVGLAVPSPLDGQGRLSERILPAWRGIDVGELVYRRYGLPVLVDNDANLGALAEAWWGAGHGVDDFAYVKVASGVGAGYILRGEIFRGSSGTAGEIGHCAVAPSGRTCRCGLSGCLEAEVGSRAIVEKAAERLSAHPGSALATVSPLTLPAVVAAARAGDPLSIEIISDAGRHLGIALANLVNLLNPSRVVLGGHVTMAKDFLLPALFEAMSERALATNVAGAEVRISDLSHGVARGAATLVLRWALDHAHVLERTHADPAPQPRAAARLPRNQTLAR